MPYQTHILNQDLYDRICNNDLTFTELDFGKNGTKFFGEDIRLECYRQVYVDYEIRRVRGGPVHKTVCWPVEKQLSYNFFYDPHQLGDDVSSPTQKKVPYKFTYQTKPNAIRGISGIEELAEALKLNTTITSIDTVSDDPCTQLLDERDSLTILASIKSHPRLTSLYLDTAKLGNEAFHCLTSMLIKNKPPLKFLSINSEDVISDKNKLLALLDAVRLNNTLETIHIGHRHAEETLNVNTKSSSSFRQSSSSTTIGVHSDTETIIQAIQETVARRVQQATQTQAITTDADFNYAKGKAAFLLRNKLDALTFFKLAKDAYKAVKRDSTSDTLSVSQAEKRLLKLADGEGENEGKYSKARILTL